MAEVEKLVQTSALRTILSAQKEYIDSAVGKKQDKLTQGTGITISGNTISVNLDLNPYKVCTSKPAKPADGDENKIHLVPTGKGTDNEYTEYIWTGGKWEVLGTIAADVDLSTYATKASVDSLTQTVNAKADAADLKNYALKSSVDSVTEKATSNESEIGSLKTKVSSLETNKADKATTLAGYDITDATLTGNTVKLGANSKTFLSEVKATDLPKATATTLGGIMVGDRLSIDETGKLSATVQEYTLTKTAVEGVLTGDIKTHTHSQYLTAVPAEYAKTADVVTEVSAATTSGKSLSWKKGGTAQTDIVIPFATKASSADSATEATHATSADTANSAAALSVAPTLAASTGNNIKVTVGGQTSNDFTVPYATKAGTATNLDDKPVFAAGTGNNIKITVGGQTSTDYTIPYATKAGSADSATTATNATNATNLAVAPSIGAGTTANTVKVTAGGKSSADYTIPYATKAGSADSATTATNATQLGGVAADQYVKKSEIMTSEEAQALFDEVFKK